MGLGVLEGLVTLASSLWSPFFHQRSECLNIDNEHNNYDLNGDDIKLKSLTNFVTNPNPKPRSRPLSSTRQL